MVLGVFAVVCFLGITSFSHVLSYALRRFRNVTLAVLSGFMLGSLNKVWPWKAQVKELVEGQTIVVEQNVLPGESLTEGVVLMLTGFILVYVLEKISAKKG